MYCNPNCNPARVAPLVALCAPGAGLSARAICDERCERFSGRVSPADAERVPGWVGPQDPDGPQRVAQIRGRLSQAGSQRDCLLMRGFRIVHVQVEVHLLRVSVRPVGRNIVGFQLHARSAHSPAASVTLCQFVLEDVPAENASPKRALGMQVGRFSGLRITVQDWPRRSRCLLSGLR